MELTKLIDYLNKTLQPQLVRDYCPNGLQVQGKPTIKKLVSGVTASQALIKMAVEHGADALLAHHGYFWQGEDACITGIKQARLKTLLENNISLISYHLPLDIHPEYGNNAQLAKQLGLQTKGRFSHEGLEIIFHGNLVKPCSGADFKSHLEKCLGRKPLHIADTNKPIHSIAWCTGAAQDFIHIAMDYGMDAYLTGEVSERTVHSAREGGIHFYAAGHHATERYGVKALGEHLADRFGIEHEFVDIPNPV